MTIDAIRTDIKHIAAGVLAMKVDAVRTDIEHIAAGVLAMKVGMDNDEAIANIMLAYRHLEDASMRLGMVAQALYDGVSAYDRRSLMSV